MPGTSARDQMRSDRRKKAAAIDIGPLDNAVGYLLRRAQLAIFDDFIRTFADLGLRPATFSVLVLIDRNPGLNQSEISAALGRVDDEEAAWFVAIDSGEKVGMVFGELVHGEVDVRIWIHPDHRKRGYGTAALRKSRSEMAWCFPAVPMVVRAPAANPR